MAGKLDVQAPKVSAQGTVGLPPTVRNALSWHANQHPNVVQIDAAIAALRADDTVSARALDERIRLLKAQREIAVAQAIREAVA